MFFFMRAQPVEHYVDNGCVYCPRRKRDVEVDVCSGCQALSAIDLEAELPYVACEGAPA
ncbi:MAG TPA: hypothetical protein VF280_07375 [Burkholderiales bacterium]|jgi:hypothetical protein